MLENFYIRQFKHWERDWVDPTLNFMWRTKVPFAGPGVLCAKFFFAFAEIGTAKPREGVIWIFEQTPISERAMLYGGFEYAGASAIMYGAYHSMHTFGIDSSADAQRFMDMLIRFFYLSISFYSCAFVAELLLRVYVAFLCSMPGFNQC